MKVTLLIFTINEEIGMKKIMPQIDKSLIDQIIICDGGSVDKTCEIAKEHNCTIYKQKQKGLSRAYAEVWPLIKGDIVITFSPDGNSLPNKIPELIQEMRSGKDMVIVSRYLGDAKSYDDSLLSGFGNSFFTKSINLFHGGKYTDALVMFRAYKKNIFYSLQVDQYKYYQLYDFLFFTHIGVEPLLSVRAAKAKLKIGEIPGDEPKRIGGRAKLQIIRWSLAYYLQILFEIFISRKNFFKER